MGTRTCAAFLTALAVAFSACSRASARLGATASALESAPPGSSSGTPSSGNPASDPTPPSPAPQIDSFTTSAPQGASGSQTATLSWVVEGVSVVTLLPAVGGRIHFGPVGSIVVPAGTTATYGLTAVNAGGSAAGSVVVAPPTSSASVPAPAIVSAQAATAPDPAFETSTVTLVVSGVSSTGNNTVVSDCPGPGATGTPAAATQTVSGPNESIVVALALPQQDTPCSFLVTGPNGVGAPPVVVHPFWAAVDLAVSFASPSEVDTGQGDYWYVLQYAAVTINAVPATPGAFTLPANTPVLVRYYNYDGGGQAAFIDTGTTDTNGNFGLAIGGCNVALMANDFTLTTVVTIGNHSGEAFLAIRTPAQACPAS